MERALYEQNRFDMDSAACYIEPQLVAGGAPPATVWLGMANYDKIMFIILGGDWSNANGDTLDAWVTQATDNAATGEKAIAGKAISTYTNTAADENNLWYIHIDISELDVDGGYAFVKLYVSVSAADTVYLAAICHRQSRVFEPVPTTRVREIIN